MTKNHISRENACTNQRGRLVLLAALVAVGILCAWWLVGGADRAMGEGLLNKTWRVAGWGVNHERKPALTGTKADGAVQDPTSVSAQPASGLAERRKNQKTAIRIGVLANRGYDMCLEEWGPTAEYLNERLAPLFFEIVPLDFEQIIPAIRRGEVDFVSTNPSYYAYLEHYGLIRRIVTLQVPAPSGPQSRFGGVILSRVDRKDIKNLSDLQGKRFAAVSERSLGGWHAALRELLVAGINPERDFGELVFSGTHDAVVKAVLDGYVDAGTVRTTQLERMFSEGLLDMDTIQVIGSRAAEYPEYPYALSSRLYPEWPLAALADTDPDLSKRVAVALLQMEADHEAARSIRGAGWSTPEDYAPVHELLRVLRLPPYEKYGQLTAGQALRTFWPWLLGLLILILLLWGFNLRFVILNRRLQAGEAHLSATLRSISDGVVACDAKGRVTSLNTVAERLTGWSNSEAAGRLLEEVFRIVNAHTRETVENPVTRALAEGMNVDLASHTALIAKDGTEHQIADSCAPIRDTSGAITGAVLVFRDVTEEYRWREELQETNRELEDATARANEMAAQAQMASIAKSEFLANMSHEIRTPMNGVIGMTGLLLDTGLTEEQRRFAETIKSSGESLLGLLNDILDFSKIEAGKLDLETLDFDLQVLLDDFAATMALKAHDKGLELLCAADPDVPLLLSGDPGRLRQILANLTGNAVKFTPKGEVTVRVSRVQETEERINDSCLLRFSVRDTGIGIPADKIDILFGQFTQVDASTTRQYGGTGLGLAISKQLAGLMGGEVGVESVESQGSEFWFTARFGLQSEASREKIPLPAVLSGVRVLIIDDNATNREILLTRLSSWGMRPEEAHDGPSGLEALYRALGEADPFRLAVVDMQMPGMDGEAVGRAVKADAKLADTRLVMLTSLGMRGDARRLQEIGFAAYATKPVRHKELKGVLSQALAAGPDAPLRPIATRHTAREALPDFADRKARILLAEDNITNQQVAVGILKKLGLSADAVANGREAIEALKTLPYDLVLMDVQMPEMDGLEATRHIRNPQTSILHRSIPIIAMTAHAMRGDKEKCLEAGMDDYVAKPVVPLALAEVLDKWLPKKGKDGMKERGVESQQPKEKSQKSEDDRQSLSCIWDRAAMLERLMGDEDLAEAILQGFITDMPRQIKALKGYLEAGDVAGAERQAHTIMGAAGNVGAEALRALAFELEQAGKAGDLERIKTRMDELAASFAALLQAMEKDPP
ncbi:response regulator [Desulfobulbus alkaliphilus]|uniref:response regulator n=1 Tax=Desulfobulbus alkaliphilus TaxID=869814 RepID=UPI00196556FD|nr:PhnD/SsuA/transferrin family substrate-binding protein [Desulfobulbus alkaliphilus]MBM9537817.1 PhnD/SsuA/transferrin family substrate-binding protein [Desulfobulbus alkaliphilus]